MPWRVGQTLISRGWDGRRQCPGVVGVPKELGEWMECGWVGPGSREHPERPAGLMVGASSTRQSTVESMGGS